ncbi:MAG: hypothetical protein IJO57_01535 [Bacilli bacterium]|nr:hypothetical protein [Bacilli bacterium]
MAKKMQSIYEYFNNYSEKEIDNVINGLSDSEKLVVRERYGNDLHNPESLETWGRESSIKFIF